MGILTLNISIQDNQPPNSSGWLSISLAFNSTHIFTVANFTTETTPPYADPEGDAFKLIKITSIPSQGVLKINGVVASVNDEVTSAQLAANELTYESDGADNDGYSNSEMEFLVSDIGSNLFNTSPNSVLFSVSGSVNLPPTSVGDGEQNIIVGSITTFTRVMLTSQLNPPYEDPESNPAENLLVVSVPNFGLLKLNGVIVVDGQIISFTDIDSGLLTYTNEGIPENSTEGFSFKISDTGSGIYVG
jgi:hypothetical protein